MTFALGWPQLFVLGLFIFGLFASAAVHGQTNKVNFFGRFIWTTVWLVVLWAGGFFAGNPTVWP